MNTRWLLVACMALFSFAVQAQQGAASAADAAASAPQAPASAKVSPRQRAEFEKAALADQNKQTGAGVLAANKAKPGVTNLPSGVQYRVLKAGSGKRPTDASVVLCRYKGTLADGAVFDKTDEKTPAQLKVAGLVAGLREAVKLMSVGAQWEVVVPPQLGYGARGREGVGPNAVLTYVVVLDGIL